MDSNNTPPVPGNNPNSQPAISPDANGNQTQTYQSPTPEVHVAIHQRRLFEHIFKPWSIWKSVDLVLVVGVGIILGYILFQPKIGFFKSSNTSTKSSTQSSKSPSTSTSASSTGSTNTTTGSSSTGATKGVTSTGSSGSTNPAALTTTYITVPTGVNETSATVSSSSNFTTSGPSAQFGPSGNYATPFAPKDTAATASGHYVYIDTSVDYSNSTYEGGKLLYDGKTIYQGSQIVPYSQVISQNGLHYAYVTDDGTNYHIYIDNKLAYSLNDQDSLYLLGLSNDGQTIIYDYEDSNSNDILYENGKLMLSLVSLGGWAFSSDLQHSVIDATDAGGDDQVLKDGKVTLASDSGDNMNLSNNGLHYDFLSTNSDSTINSLNVDGRNLGPVTDPSNIGVDNNGDYFYIDDKDAILYINTKPVQLNTAAISDDEWGSFVIAVNNDASHYLVANPSQNYYFLDGKVISLSGDIFQTEFENNTLYVYRFSN